MLEPPSRYPRFLALFAGLALLSPAAAPAREARPAHAHAAASTASAWAKLPAEPRPFSATSIWNTPVRRRSPLDPGSGLITSVLRTEAERELRADTGPYVAVSNGIPVYVVPAHQRLVRVQLDSWDFGTSLTEALSAGVPVPGDAKPNSADHAMEIWQPSTNRLWDMYQMHKRSDGWHVVWGGAMQHVSRNEGFFDSKAWPGASNRWGATASSFPFLGGLMLAREVHRLRINHALALAVSVAKQGEWAWPAQRTDGWRTSPGAIPEGAHFRIDPSLDLSRIDMPPITRAMAEAAQKYGIIVTNQTGIGLCFWAEDPSQYGVDYKAATLGLYPTQYLRSFPWKHLQLLKMHLAPH